MVNRDYPYASIKDVPEPGKPVGNDSATRASKSLESKGSNPEKNEQIESIFDALRPRRLRGRPAQSDAFWHAKIGVLVAFARESDSGRTLRVANHFLRAAHESHLPWSKLHAVAAKLQQLLGENRSGLISLRARQNAQHPLAALLIADAE